MSRVIKNNDGVAVIEGTPAASLVKDVDKFFAAKPPERMAGESIGQPRKLDPKAINTRSPIPVQRRLSKEEVEFMERLTKDRLAGIIRTPKEEEALRDEMFRTEDPLPKDTEQIDNPSKKPIEDERRFTGGSKDFNERTGRVEPNFRKESQGRNDRRNEARDKAESRRKRFFERKKYAERSQREQEATQGKFITTLGT